MALVQFGFYGISTIVDYLMPNPLFQVIQFNISTQFYLGPYQVLPLWLSGPGNDDSKQLLHISQSSSITV